MTNNKELLARSSHIVYDPSVNYSSSSSALSNIAWGRVTLAFAGVLAGTWVIVKISNLVFNGRTNRAENSRSADNPIQQKQEQTFSVNSSFKRAILARRALKNHPTAKNMDSRVLLRKMC